MPSAWEGKFKRERMRLPSIVQGGALSSVMPNGPFVPDYRLTFAGTQSHIRAHFA